MSSKKIRVDDLLVKRGFFENRDLAMRACIAGEITSNDVHIKAPSQLVFEDIDLKAKKVSRFVSRGGDKLQGALDKFNFSPENMKCLDVGCSTGGFTDCLLSAGAKEVTCVDVGYGQFAMKLRNDERITLFERTNIKDADCDMLGGPFDLLTADLSFISLSKLLCIFKTLIKNSGFILVLVKPQFEADKDSVGENGVVWQAFEHINVLNNLFQALSNEGFKVRGLTYSSLLGPAGNIEFFILASNEAGSVGADSVSIDIDEVVYEAHLSLRS